MIIRLLCPKCGHEVKDEYNDDVICDRCGKAYMLPLYPEKETPGVNEDDHFMKKISPEMPYKDMFNLFNWDCPTCGRPNRTRRDIRCGKVQGCVCVHCGNYVKVNVGGVACRR